MHIYLVLLIIQLPPVMVILDITAAILLLVYAITSRHKTRHQRVGLLLCGLGIALNAFNGLYTILKNTRVPLVMITLSALLTICGSVIMIAEWLTRRKYKDEELPSKGGDIHNNYGC